MSINFWTEFWLTLRWRPAQALSGLYWHLTGRRVRARNRMRVDFHLAPHAYTVWRASVEHSAKHIAAAREVMAAWPRRPSISIILTSSESVPPGDLEASISSLEMQILEPLEILLVLAEGAPVPRVLDRPSITIVRGATADPSEQLTSATLAARGEWLLPLAPGGLLPPLGTFHYASAALRGDAEIIYGDHDWIHPRGKWGNPWLKPLWNPEMMLAQDYISPACLVATSAARAVLPLAPEHATASVFALILPVAWRSRKQVVHVPEILVHLPAGRESPNAPARAGVVTKIVGKQRAMTHVDRHDLVRVEWPLPPEPPTVTVIIPTRDKVELLRTCVESLFERTLWPAYDVIVVDNGSVEPETLAFLAALRQNSKVRVIDWPRPYNYAEINNAAARVATGEYLCLLNNDTEVIEPRWLELMVRHAIRDEVGAVGARLLYGDGTIQHAGVVIGMGNAAGHAHRGQKVGDPGYFLQADVTRFVSAVTAACLVVAKAKFNAVGGLDAEKFAIAYNDVDLCLRLTQAGWRNIYEPHAVLMHYESLSRGDDFSPEHRDRYMRELAALQERWGTSGYCDPLFHPQLDPAFEVYTLRLGS